MSASAHHPEQASSSTRACRAFSGVVSAADGGLISAWAVPLVRFATFAVRDLAEEACWFDIGTVDEFRSVRGAA
jgi:hypothetical protein